MSKFNQETCEVCHEPIVDVEKLPPELRDKVYRPSADEVYNADVMLGDSGGFQQLGNGDPHATVDINIE